MSKAIKLKTTKNNRSVSAYIQTLDPRVQKDAKVLLKLFKDVTGMKPVMWGASIIGFGSYTYHRSNGDEGQFMAIGFSMRKSGPTIYIMPGYKDYSKLLEKLGPHKLGKSCLYLKNLSKIDQEVLAKLIRAGLKDLKKTHQTSY
ncbi:MAG: DUF1801 domain-containing protein [Candidatus Paceibacterota bacterium]